MVEELWSDVERQAMDNFKKEIKNHAESNKQFNTVEEGMKWMKEIRT